jgi:hypothetical protein
MTSLALVLLIATLLHGTVAQYTCTKTVTTNGQDPVSYDISILTRTYESSSSDLAVLFCNVRFCVYCTVRSADGNGLKANWYAKESHTQDLDYDGQDDYTYFFNLCAPLVNVPAILADRVEYFRGDVGVLQVSSAL